MPHCETSVESCIAEVLEHEQLAKDTMRLRLSTPASHTGAVPGQFFMLRDHRSTDPLIGRAFACYDCDPHDGWIDIVYLVKGKFTRSICQLRANDVLSIWGPLGNSFNTSTTDHLVMVAGGIGQTPFLTLAKEALGLQRFGTRTNGYARRVTLCYGARSAEYVAGIDAFRQIGVSALVATDDGTIGPPQRVTDMLVNFLNSETQNPKSDFPSLRLACCGPEPMMEAVAHIARERAIACEVSLETPMACGLGICFSCVTRVGTSDDWDYRRTCVEGPIFDAQSIVW